MNTRFFFLLFLCFITLTNFAVSSDPDSSSKFDQRNLPSYGEVLDLLALDMPDLKKVKDAHQSKEDDLAMAELLNYYRRRTTVHHITLNHFKNATRLGSKIFPEDAEAAEKGLRHLFKGQRSYPFSDRGVDIDWVSNPQKDNEFLWQLHRMNWWVSYGKVYLSTGEEKYAQEWAYEMMDWYKKTPNDKSHSYAWRTIEAGGRASLYTAMFEYFIDSPSFTPQLLSCLLQSVHEHAEYLMGKKSFYNWFLIESSGLLSSGIHFPEFSKAKSWRNEAVARFAGEINKQVLPDGVQCELSTSYHEGSLGDFWNAFALLKANSLESELPVSYKEKIEQMLEAVMKWSLPDRTKPQFGDSWKGAPGFFKSWNTLIPNPNFLWLATEGAEGTPPADTAYALPSAGIYSMRSDWGPKATMLVLKCGNDGGWHCQPDNNTFELFALGRHFMPDSGSYIYSGNAEGRKWFRRTASHQTLTLNQQDTLYAPKLLAWKPSPEVDTLITENAGYSDLTHRRAIFFVKKKYFVIVDDAIGKATGDVQTHFQFLPCQAVFDKKKLLARTDLSGPNLVIQSTGMPGTTLQEDEGWVSFQYTIKEKRPAFSFVQKKSDEKTLRLISVLVPYEGPVPEISVLDNSKHSESDKYTLQVKVDEEKFDINYVLKAEKN